MSLSLILGCMFGLILFSIVVELILPQGFKDRLGALICWTMMAVTMTFLGLATVGLLYGTWQQYLKPLFT